MVIGYNFRDMMENLLNEASEKVLIRRNQESQFDDWGELVNDYEEEEEVDALIETYNVFNRETTEGAVVGGGDIVFVFKHNVNIESGDEIEYNNQKYNILNIVSEYDSAVFVEASIK